MSHDPIQVYLGPMLITVLSPL